jgi:hypothetical protein
MAAIGLFAKIAPLLSTIVGAQICNITIAFPAHSVKLAFGIKMGFHNVRTAKRSTVKTVNRRWKIWKV